MSGVPFESMERLGTPRVVARAHDLARRRQELIAAITKAEAFFDRGEHVLSREAFRAFRSAVRALRAPDLAGDSQPPIVVDYASALANATAAESELEVSLEVEIDRARKALFEEARKYLPRQLMFNVGGVRELLNVLLASTSSNGTIPRRNTRVRERERHLLLYLQRICAKNDSFSEFGPTSWGKADSGNGAVSFSPDAGITSRETFLERWTAHALAAAMNRDPAVRNELVPRLNPHGRLVADTFVFADTGEAIALTTEEHETLRACDGSTRAYAIASELLRSLLERNVIRCEVEVPALEPHAFTVLRNDVLAWRPGDVRDRWLGIIEPIAALPDLFARTDSTAGRQEILDQARSHFSAIGIEREAGERHLYSARNPIGEECFRETRFQIDGAMLDELATEAAPWINLWRDSYAFIASRVAAGLRSVLDKMPAADGAVPLPAFLRACESAGLRPSGPGLVVLAHLAFQEVKAGFRRMMEPHRDKVEYELTAKDCAFVRNTFEYPKFDEYTYPSADLQIAATSAEAVRQGEYQWVLAELHPPAALLHHGAYWSCPDKEALHAAFARTIENKPNFHFGFFAADFTAHTSIRIFDALPDHTNFVSAQRGNPRWRTVAPADAEVFVEAGSGDVGVRHRATREYLGSFARAWLIPLGFHPFQFGMTPHMPRLRCGNVIVQRRTWTVTREELGFGDYSGVSQKLVLAVEHLRAAKGWPRYIYIRPTEQALRRSGAEGRDKDTKPVFIDLESYLFLEIFHGWLTKAGELEVTEMLPDPAHLLWKERDGRRSFELRTLIVPAS
jgi:hypothetical protein